MEQLIEELEELEIKKQQILWEIKIIEKYDLNEKDFQ